MNVNTHGYCYNGGRYGHPCSFLACDQALVGAATRAMKSNGRAGERAKGLWGVWHEKREPGPLQTHGTPLARLHRLLAGNLQASPLLSQKQYESQWKSAHRLVLVGRPGRSWAIERFYGNNFHTGRGFLTFLSKLIFKSLKLQINENLFNIVRFLL